MRPFLWLIGSLAASGVLPPSPAAQESAPQQKPSPEKAASPAKQEEGKQTPPTKEPPKEETAKEPKEGEEEAAEPEAKAPTPGYLVDFGWADWALSGLERKFRQYATPPRGWFLRDLRIAPLFAPRKQDIFLNVKSLGQPDYSADGSVSLRFGETRLGGSLTRNRFFDVTPAFIPPSERRVDQFFVRQWVAPAFSVSMRYRQDDQKETFEPPRGPWDQSTRYRDITAGGRLGPGYLNLSLLDWQYQDRTLTLPPVFGKGLNLEYIWEPLRALGVETAFSRIWLEQAGAATSRVDTFSLNTDYALSPSTDLGIYLRQRHLDLPVVQNTWVREQRTGDFSLSHRWRGWSSRIGLRLQEAERIRSDQSFVDVPRWRTFEARLSGRLNRYLRMSLRGFDQVLTNVPVMNTQDGRSLYWNQRDMLQFRLDGRFPNLNGYLTYTNRQWRNADRRVNLNLNQVTLGGDWQVAPSLNLFSEYSLDAWAGSSEITAAPTLGNFSPDSHVTVLGLNWIINERASLSLSLTDFRTENDNPLLLRNGNTHGQFFTLNGRYQAPNGYELGLVLAPWTYDDRVVNSLNYDATVFMVTIAGRF